MMAPRVDRPVVRAPRQVELAGRIREDPVGDRSATWKDTEIVRTSGPVVPVTLQGSRCMPPGDRNVVRTDRHRLGGRLAQLVRALP